jgi:outer membrane protein OmpU
MKKLLLATTALVGFAGAAAAEVTISGSAEMGIVGGGVGATNGSGGETQFFQDIDVTFTLSGETDSGLSFGAAVDLDEAGNLGDEFSNQGVAIFLRGAFGNLTMGDTDGAIDWAITDAGNIGNPGSIDDAETSHLGYNGSFGDGAFDNQVLRYDNTFGAFGVALSYEQGATGAAGTLLPGDSNGSLALGAKYALDLGGTTVNLGAGYMQSEFIADDRTIVALGASASFGGGFQAGVTYQDWDYDVADDVTHLGLGIGYESGPFSIHANWGEYDFDTGADQDGYGIAAAYDLGGGVKAHVAYADSDDGTATDYSTWSLGLSMSF